MVDLFGWEARLFGWGELHVDESLAAWLVAAHVNKCAWFVIF